jgi:hypothetical protein
VSPFAVSVSLDFSVQTLMHGTCFLLQTHVYWRMPPSGMLCHVALVRKDVSEERTASIIRVTRIDELGMMLAVTSNQCMLRRNTKDQACLLIA